MMRKIHYIVKMGNPIWFFKASRSYMQGYPREFWLGAIPAYVRYLRATIGDARHV